MENIHWTEFCHVLSVTWNDYPANNLKTFSPFEVPISYRKNSNTTNFNNLYGANDVLPKFNVCFQILFIVLDSEQKWEILRNKDIYEESNGN